MRLRPRLAVTSVGMVLVAGLLTPTATTRAAFSDTATVSASTTTTLTVPAPAQGCTNTTSGVRLRFTPASVPGTSGTPLSYSASASRGPTPDVPTSGSPRDVLLSSSDYRGVLTLGGTLVVTITATMPGTSWTRSTTTTLNVLSILGLTGISCP